MERRLVLIPSLIAFTIVLATDVLYVGLIQAFGPPPDPYTPRFVASYLAVLASIIVLAVMPRPEMAVIRVPLRAAAAGGLLVMGFIGSFSIGLPLVVAGVLVTIALTRTARTSGSMWWRLSGLVAATVAVAVLVAGLEVTERLIVCPETGTSSGGGSGLLTGRYHYECNNGRLRWSSG